MDNTMDELEDMLKHLERLFNVLEKEADFSEAPIPDFCSGITCMGTPAEMVSLIKAGYGCTLSPLRVTVVVGNRKGEIAYKEIPMLQFINDENGCAMYKNGKCLLWESGLTPMMGKLHLLKGGMLGTKTKKFLIHIVVMEWLDPDNASDIECCLKGLVEINKNSGNNHTN